MTERSSAANPAFGEEPRALREPEIDLAASTVAGAFAWHEPWGEWALPQVSSREGTLLRLIADDLRERYLPSGECSTIAGLSVTLWEPPANHPKGAVFAARRSEAEYEAFGPQAEAMRAGDELISTLRPAGEHWYLDTFATAPEVIGRGLGGRLLRHDLSIRDMRKESCVLETHTRRNVAFYERHGFELVAEGQLPCSGPDLFVMTRPPRS